MRSELPEFPTVRWNEFAATVTFKAAEADEPAQPGAEFVIVFAASDSAFVLGSVRGRGWCTPSGHIEPGEEAEAAARREALEETGAELDDLRLIGHFCFAYDDGRSGRLPAFAGSVLRRGPIPSDSEATDVRPASLKELPNFYYRWDPLLEQVFAYAATITFRSEPAPPSADRQPR